MFINGCGEFGKDEEERANQAAASLAHAVRDGQRPGNMREREVRVSRVCQRIEINRFVSSIVKHIEED